MTHTLTTEDVVIAAILLNSDEVCARWARVSYDGVEGDTLVHLPGEAIPRQITVMVIRTGLWQISLHRSDSLPRGVTRDAQRAILDALAAGDADNLRLSHMDQAIQVGLFGEVRH